MKFAPIRKAILAYLLPFLGSLGAACSDGHLTGPEITVALGIGLATGTGVYLIPNNAA